MPHYIGIDGGGTKTTVCLFSGHPPSLRRAGAGGASWREHGAPEVARRLQKAVRALAGGEYGNIAGVAAGLPCHGESAEGDRALERAVREAFPGIPLYLTNDVEVGWAGSLALEPGINVVAGTGSIAFGADAGGATARSGGWSELFGDEGSCYWVALGLLGLFSKQADGRMPKDALYDTVCRELGLKNGMDLIDVIHPGYARHRDRLAGLQPLAEKAALAGSASAKALYRRAAHELFLLAKAVRGRLNLPEEGWPVSYSGGLFKAKKLVLPFLSGRIRRAGGRMLAPRFTPEEGAVLLAVRHTAPERLAETQQALLRARREQPRR